jgi:hypothetical protein
LFCLDRPSLNQAEFFESRGGFVTRVQQSRGGFQKMRLYFSTVRPLIKINTRPQKIKLPFQQKSRDPHQVSLNACNKAAATVITKGACFESRGGFVVRVQ